MENASQALFMAAGVLIAVMIISIGVYLFTTASTISENYDMTMSANEIQKFNSKFSKYEKTPTYITQDGYVNRFYNYNTVSDVVSALNQAYSINAKNNYDIQSSIQIRINLAIKKFDTSMPDWVGITPNVQRIFFNASASIQEDKDRVYVVANRDKNSNNAHGSLYHTNELLKAYSNSKLDEAHERVYQYGFSGQVFMNEETGLIDNVEFTLVENAHFPE